MIRTAVSRCVAPDKFEKVWDKVSARWKLVDPRDLGDQEVTHAATPRVYSGKTRNGFWDGYLAKSRIGIYPERGRIIL